jgi:hypothetical protein
MNQEALYAAFSTDAEELRSQLPVDPAALQQLRIASRTARHLRFVGGERKPFQGVFAGGEDRRATKRCAHERCRRAGARMTAAMARTAQRGREAAANGTSNDRCHAGTEPDAKLFGGNPPR